MPEIRKCVRNLCVFALGLCGGSAQAASEPQIFLDGLETPPTLVVYYVSGEGAHGIYRGRRVDGGWQRGEQVLLDGVFDGDAVDPDVLREPDGSFRLYYFRGHFVTPPPPLPEPSRFYSAHSSDGLNFSIDGEVFALDNSTDPSVVRLPDGQSGPQRPSLYRGYSGHGFRRAQESDHSESGRDDRSRPSLRLLLRAASGCAGECADHRNVP